MKIKYFVTAGLMAALTAISGWIRISVFPVPFTLQTLMVYLAGDILDAKTAVLSQALFLLIGLSGIPVFASGGGPGYLLNPAFGYLLGFPVAAGLISMILNKTGSPPSFFRFFLVNGTGMLIILFSGAVYMFFCLNFILGKEISFGRAITGGFLIFLPVEMVKIICAAGMSLRMRRILPLILGIALAWSFPGEQAIAQNQSRLVKVRKEIQLLEKELKDKEYKETTILEQMENLDREIGLRQDLLGELERERKRVESAVAETQIRFQQAEESRERQRDIVRRRIVSIYKRGRMADWQVLFSIHSLNQMLVWNRYQIRIMENDQRNFRLLKGKEYQVALQKTTLENKLNQKRQLIQETVEEKDKLETDRTKRKKVLAQVQREKEPIKEKLRQKRLAFKKIEGWIAEEEQKKREEAQNRSITEPPPVRRSVSPGSNWMWPVQGKVVSRYGKQLDTATRTETENLGIDIQAGENEKVQSVLGGQVKYVTWLRGMGNLLLLDHGGIYTVYGHLYEVFVNAGESVEQGQILGRVGDRSGLYGSILHFEVWKGTVHSDPLVWLR
jgi:biotin transporter BioY/septal ring factor EnvC (AmiA/AmiB activator)